MEAVSIWGTLCCGEEWDGVAPFTSVMLWQCHNCDLLMDKLCFLKRQYVLLNKAKEWDVKIYWKGVE